MSWFKELCFTLVIALVATNCSQAAPVSLQLTLTNDSSLELFIDTLSGLATSSVSFDLSGTVDITLDDAIDDISVTNDTSSISFDDATIVLSDETFDLSLGVLGGVEGEFFGLTINTLNSNGPIPITPTGLLDPFPYTFDPGGGSPTQLAIDEGTWTYLGTGSIGGIPPGPITFEFGSNPIEATVNPVGQIGLVTQDATLTGTTLVVDVVVSTPITFSDALITDPTEVNNTFSGAIVATGSYTTIVPEPTSLVLLGIAAAALIPLWRRRSRS